MTKKSPPFRIAPLQKVVAEPVTDLAEQANLDQQRGRRSKAIRTRGGNHIPEPVPSPVFTLCQQLPAEDRPALLMQVASLLSPEEQLDLLEQLTAQLPAGVARQLEEELRTRLAQRSS